MRVAIYVGELGTACLVIVEDGVDLAGHHLQAVPAEQTGGMPEGLGRSG